MRVVAKDLVLLSFCSPLQEHDRRVSFNSGYHCTVNVFSNSNSLSFICTCLKHVILKGHAISNQTSSRGNKIATKSVFPSFSSPWVPWSTKMQQ